MTAIQKAKDLSKLSLYELMGLLINHELIIQHENKDEHKRRKTIALQAAMKKAEESKNELSSDNAIQDEDLAMIMRKFRKFMERKKYLVGRVLRKKK